jgi:hypothetical protein
LLQIGTTAATADVMHAGIALPQWAPVIATAFEPGTAVTVAFWLWSAGNSTVSLVGAQALCQTPTVCAVSLEAPGVMAPAPAMLLLTFECTTLGDSRASVSVQPAGFGPSLFEFTKQCAGAVLVLVSLRDLSVSRVVCSIGYFSALNLGHDAGSSDVIANGIVQAAYIPDVASFLVGGLIPMSSYSVALSVNITQHNVIASGQCVDSSVCTLAITLDSASLSPLPTSLRVLYTCLREASTEAQIRLQIPGYADTVFAVVKACSGALTASQTVRFSDLTRGITGPRPSLSIGLSSGQSDVVAGGVAQPAWVSSAPAATIGTPVIQQTFYLTLMASGGANQSVGPGAVTASPSAALAVVADGAVTESLSLCAGCSSSEFDLRFECALAGTVQVSVRLQVQGYDDVVFGFKKLCGGTHTHLLAFSFLILLFFLLFGIRPTCYPVTHCFTLSCLLSFG